MSQPPIDLLPAVIRSRSMAGVVIAQYAAALVVAVVAVVGPAVLAHVERKIAAEKLREQAECEERVKKVELEIVKTQAQVDRETADVKNYDALKLPLPVSRVLATLVNEMPPALTLEQFDLTVKSEVAAAAPTAGRPTPAEPRERPRLWLAGELRGFAPDDIGPADFTGRLKRLGLCRAVKLEHVQDREKPVRGAPARSFLISLVIDLDRVYEWTDRKARAPIPVAAESPPDVR